MGECHHDIFAMLRHFMKKFNIERILYVYDMPAY